MAKRPMRTVFQDCGVDVKLTDMPENEQIQEYIWYEQGGVGPNNEQLMTPRMLRNAAHTQAGQEKMDREMKKK